MKTITLFGYTIHYYKKPSYETKELVFNRGTYQTRMLNYFLRVFMRDHETDELNIKIKREDIIIKSNNETLLSSNSFGTDIEKHSFLKLLSKFIMCYDFK